MASIRNVASNSKGRYSVSVRYVLADLAVYAFHAEMDFGLWLLTFLQKRDIPFEVS